VDIGVNDPLAAIATKQAVFTRINDLLDQAKVHLVAGGTVFPFTLDAGFAGFNTPTNFLKVNRAIKARVDVYQKNWVAALQDLTESFVDTTKAMSLGAYASYSTNSGDVVNPLFDPLPRTLMAWPDIKAEAQLRAGGAPDLRATQKTLAFTPIRVLNGITDSLKWNIYKTAGDPVPIIKNEELILLRAEANLQNGDRASAIKDINVVRVVSGGLAPLASDPGLDPSIPANLSGDLLIDELLYNRHYSLIWEGAHRWIDMRRYGLLAKLPRARVGDIVVPYAALPDDECVARNNPPPCTPPPNL